MASGNPAKGRKEIILPGGDRYVRDTGVEQESIHKFHQDIPDPAPGEHLWVITGLWSVKEPSQYAGKEVHLDVENLLTIDGPGCFMCEQMWTRELEKQPCPGEPDA